MRWWIRIRRAKIHEDSRRSPAWYILLFLSNRVLQNINVYDSIKKFMGGILVSCGIYLNGF